METPLVATTFFMGLAGGPHCIAMCGAACGGIQKSAAGIHIWKFHTGRLMGYATLGALAAASVNTLAWISDQTLALQAFKHIPYYEDMLQYRLQNQLERQKNIVPDETTSGAGNTTKFLHYRRN